MPEGKSDPVNEKHCVVLLFLIEVKIISSFQII